MGNVKIIWRSLLASKTVRLDAPQSYQEIINRISHLQPEQIIASGYLNRF